MPVAQGLVPISPELLANLEAPPDNQGIWSMSNIDRRFHIATLFSRGLRTQIQTSDGNNNSSSNKCPICHIHIYTYNKNNNKITIITKRGNENNNKRKGKEQMFTCYKRGF